MLYEDEYSHRGLDKNALIKTEIIDGSNYRRKFDFATDNPAVNKTLYECAKEILYDRSGTHYESMRWIDGETGKVLFKVDYMGKSKNLMGEKYEGCVLYNDKKLKMRLAGHDNIITLHNHPNSTAPSTGDLNSAVYRNYSAGFVVTHDGRLYKYIAKEKINVSTYDMTVSRYLNDGHNLNSAQILAFIDYARDKNISVKEVIA
jgi:proteasome lid subunit RPN8/RPN11